MPPEQARGDVAAVGPRSDVYALGVILYELLTGRRPFAAAETPDLIGQIECDPPPRLTEFYPWIDRALEAACLKALAKDPADRFDTMAEFERALQEAVEPELRVVVPPPLPPSAGRRKKTVPKRGRWRTKVLTFLVASMLFLTVCVGGPVAGILYVFDRIQNKVKDITDSQARSDAEWEAIIGMWQAPPGDAGTDSLFPPAFGDGRYRRTRQDTNVADTELGITLPGRRAFYLGPEQEEFEVRVYRCPEAEAQTIQQGVTSLAAGRQNGIAAPPGSKREKAVYVAEKSSLRTVTFAFHDDLAQNQEYGKLWYGGGWLFWFRTTQPMGIESFPSKYLLEVGKRAGAPAKK